ncbi:MAG: NAD-dependent epimerase/dehydratase family protein [Granulosicoccus sp.]
MSTGNKVCRVLITGASGLLGYHARAAVLAENCASDFANRPRQYEYLELPRLTESTLQQWTDAAGSADLVLHLAGINRAEPDEVEFGNAAIAKLLVQALEQSGSSAHVIYANSTHAVSDSPYGRGKQAAHVLLENWAQSAGAKYTNTVLPHIFGETARPHYNNVTATLCEQVAANAQPAIHEGAKVELVHAGAAIDAMMDDFHAGFTGTKRMVGTPISVLDLHELLVSFRTSYEINTYPDLSDSFITSLFNTYRSVEYPTAFPKSLQLHKDQRGVLFEAVKGGGGGQTFLSWTDAGIERGNHFHRQKVERFLVVSGEAEIRIRAVFGEKVDVFKVNGSQPAYVDMPTFHTHSIVNTGTEPLLTLFWAHEVFDPEHPDTYSHPVLAL